MRPPAERLATPPPRRWLYLVASLFAVALVLLPFLFWYDTWFGRRLSDSQTEEYLNDAARPRRAQHALVQISQRLSHGDRSVSRWYPKIIDLARSRAVELRQTAAWVMGQDAAHGPFHEALLSMLRDPSAMVRRNVSLSLAAFGDGAARPELMAMLRPTVIEAPAAGTVRYRLSTGDSVNAGTLVARVGENEVRSALPGAVRALLRPEGSAVSAGQALVELSPDEQHAWEALRALLLVGTREDLEEVRGYARGVPGASARLRQQAMLTLRQIESRGR